MSSLAKHMFKFSKNNEQDINTKINKLQSLIRDLQRQKHQQMPIKVKNILNIAFNQQNGASLFEQVYFSCMRQSPIEWVPKLGRLLNLFSANSTFMKIIMESHDFKILIEKNFLPAYLSRNNLLNEKSTYHNISTSISGLTVPLFEYVLIRLMYALSESHFIIQTMKNLNEEYKSDDIFFYISRNPFLLILKNYMDSIGKNQKYLTRIANILKMFFVDELLLKHRINRSSSYLKELSSITARYKLKPQNLLAVYFLLQRDKSLFQERSLFFYEIVERFYSLIENENEIFFRLLFRIFTFAYSKNNVENKVLDLLQKANPNDGYFQLARYTIKEFGRSIGFTQRKQRTQYNQNKPLLLKLLEKDQNLVSYNKLSFSAIRTLGTFLQLQIHMNSGLSQKQRSEDSLRRSSEASSIQIGFEKLYRSVRSFLKKQNAKKKRDFDIQNQKSLLEQINLIIELFEKAYNRKIDLKKFQDLKESTYDRTFNIRGSNEDFTLSVESYKKDIEVNCWKVPLKDSEYQILFELFYSLAKLIDKFIPGHKPGNEPRLNLRYFCNPIVFFVTVALLVFVMKIMF